MARQLGIFKISLIAALCSLALPAFSQSFRVQCPDVSASGGGSALHPGPASKATPNLNGTIKCQHVMGTDGYATMADGSQIYIFGFGAGSGLDLIAKGLPGTQLASEFNGVFNSQKLADGVSPDPTYQDLVAENRDAAITDPTQIMTWGVLAANEPAPLVAVDEDDELYLTLSNPGQIMRPDLFEQHTIHWHGYPQASSYFDGVPDASVAINIGGSMTYYYTAPEAGTYFWHCHITPPEHLQMGMVGQLYVRPRQNKVKAGDSLYTAETSFQALDATVAAATHATIPSPCYNRLPLDPNASNLNYGAVVDLTCATPLPAEPNVVLQEAGAQYVFNDGDGSTRYDVEYPVQVMGFDPNFHYVGMTFNPEDFAGMKDKYFLLSGRGYPDTMTGNASSGNPQVGTLSTVGSDGLVRPSQPMPTIIEIKRSAGQTRALLRLSNLSVTEESTLGTIGVPMTVVGWNARQLRDMAGYNMYYNTNSITFGGGESADAILDVSDAVYSACTATAPCHYFLYSTNLDHLSNDAENFGGAMTEILVD
jgi:FtsP/CotA-like multicopper oxidase with cupredoxin domain